MRVGSTAPVEQAVRERNQRPRRTRQRADLLEHFRRREDRRERIRAVVTGAVARVELFRQLGSVRVSLSLCLSVSLSLSLSHTCDGRVELFRHPR